ncbi:unnamed protein product [Cylindrotheca closterium]|uniref:cGMP-dependent protein kinase n=1 Tax=Cylindrotheca closterium TaxID=2856 RepID=A0AAD2FXF6_9STRA|nr:unnamed protein product [Cylindrotheca closterium]
MNNETNAASKKDNNENDDGSSDESDEESFTESRWNAQKASQSLHFLSESEIRTAKTREPSHLLEKKIYRRAQPLHVDDTRDTTMTTANTNDSVAQHSEVEKAVLLDFLSKNFLLEHLDESRRSDLLTSFQRSKATKHEVLYFQGYPAEYCYLVYSGEVALEVNGKPMLPNGDPDGDKDDAEKDDDEDDYQVLGQMAALTNRPHTETAKVTSGTCTVFLLDRMTLLRAIRRRPKSLSQSERVRLLKASVTSDLLEYLKDDEVALDKLASAMTIREFSNGETIYPITDSLTIVTEGTIRASIERPGYDDFFIGPNELHKSFGWRTFEAHARVEGKMLAESDGKIIVLPREALLHAFGAHGEAPVVLERLAARRAARIQLKQIPLFHDSELSKIQLNGLLDLMHHYEYGSSIHASSTLEKEGDKEGQESPDRTIIATPKDTMKPALYFVRDGKVTLERNKGRDIETIEEGGYFGEKMMLLDQNTDGRKKHQFRSSATIVAHANTKLDVLYLKDCRKVVNTTLLGLGQAVPITALDESIQWKDVQRQHVLGCGGFGQVWLATVSTKVSPAEDSSNNDDCTVSKMKVARKVALKVQSKSKLLEMGLVKSINAEKNIMSSLNSPFVMKLFSTFQDESRLYMVTSLVEGGQLEDIVPPRGLSEEIAKFYAAGILEGLAYCHRHHIIHRDVKPGNVLIDRNGYPVLIDLGMAKYVPDKTFTWCGTPFLVSPEVIRMEGHDKATDYWSWAVMVYKLVTGKYPFRAYNEEALYRKICRGSFAVVGSYEFRSLMVAILYPNPRKRLGSSPQGWKDIFAHSWFRQDEIFSLARVQSQELPAPWLPESKKQGSDESNSNEPYFLPPGGMFVDHDDLMKEQAYLTEEQQASFQSFGPYISD